MPVFKAANTETVLIKAELCLLTTKESALTHIAAAFGEKLKDS